MKLLFLLLFIPVLFSSTLGQIVINEYSGANISNSTDGFGENEDWVELYNQSGADVDISGWFLSDKAGNIGKFQIQSGTVPANGYTMVYCSGRATTAGNDIHTNFKLTQTKPEKFIIADNGGIVVDSLTLQPCQRNHSRGRTTDGGATWSLFTTATPNGSNINAKNEYASKPTFSVPSGILAGTSSISIANTGGEDIRYTLDGSTPTVASTLYTTAINVAANTVLRAASFSSDPNTPMSFVETNTYLINVGHSVPIIAIAGDDVEDFITDNHPNAFTDNFDGSFEMFSATGTLIDEGEGFYNKHGNDSWAYDQRGFDFKMRDQYGYNYAVQHAIFNGKDRDEFTNLIIKAAANDNYPFEDGAHIRDSYVHSLSQVGELKLDERSYAPCVLYVNAQYWGLYDIREKVDDNDFLDHYYDQKELYEQSPTNAQFLKTWGSTWSEFGGAQSQIDWDDFVNYVNTNNVTDPIVWDYIDSVYNWHSLIDYFVLNSYVVSKDWLNWNTAWWRGLDQSGDKRKWRYVLWDMDATFGHYTNYTGIPDESADADPCNAEALADPGGQGHTTILNKLMDNDEFNQYYISRYIDLSNTTFSCDFMIQHLDSLLAIIEPEMQLQINRWPGGTMAGWQANVQTLKSFINDRCAALNQGMIDCYNLNGPYAMIYDVEPANAGRIKINSITPDDYPFNGDYFGGIDVLLKAIPNVSMQFDYWEIVDNIAPSTDSIKASYEPTQSQTIIAHFVEEGEERAVQYEGVHIPNAFSPNGDGQNDFLELFIGRDITEFKFQIYNRWGEMVFETNSRENIWDGTYKGASLGTAVFVYQIEFKTNEGTSEKRAGNITLMK
jgi:gliding motility-associated-like protein